MCEKSDPLLCVDDVVAQTIDRCAVLAAAEGVDKPVDLPDRVGEAVCNTQEMLYEQAYEAAAPKNI